MIVCLFVVGGRGGVHIQKHIKLVWNSKARELHNNTCGEHSYGNRTCANNHNIINNHCFLCWYLCAMGEMQHSVVVVGGYLGERMGLLKDDAQCGSERSDGRCCRSGDAVRIAGLRSEHNYAGRTRQRRSLSTISRRESVTARTYTHTNSRITAEAHNTHASLHTHQFTLWLTDRTREFM